MGGGPLVYKATMEINKSSSDLDEVNFLLYLADNGNGSLFDESFFSETLKKDIESYLKKNGIKYKYHYAERGGGGLETLGEIIKSLWEKREIVGFLVSLFGFLWKRYQNFVEDSVGRLRPRVKIHFLIETDTVFDVTNQKEVQSMLSNRLSNLLLVLRGVADYLRSEHNFLYCDISAEAHVRYFDYSIQLALSEEDRNDTNIVRMLRIIKTLVVKKHLSSSYSFTKWYAIRRSDNITLLGKQPKVKNSNYYLFLSSRLLSDYIK